MIAFFSLELQLFRSECIAAHNFFRAAHGTPPLGWSSRLAESAQSWAEQLAICGAVRNSSEKEHGENVASLWGSELTGQKVTRIWYEEARHFNYDKPRFSSRTRSFCQVIWEGSREFGVGAAVTKHGKKIVVARYFPAANKKDVAKKVKKPRITQTNDDQRIRAFDTRWSRLYLGKHLPFVFTSVTKSTAVFEILHLHFVLVLFDVINNINDSEIQVTFS